MKREQLEHLIRAASTIAEDDEIIVIRSQAILGQFPEAPAELCVSVVCEIGKLTRFPSAGRFMSYLGLVPSEHSSGGSRSRGNITKAGNGHARRVMIEA